MDLDGDGRRDVLSGSWPGTLHLFRGLEDETFAAAEVLVHEDGSEIALGKATSVCSHDWDADGRVDLLVGDLEGRVWLLPNRARRGGRLVFGDAEDLGLRVPGGDAGPCVADWDGDGRADLIVGTGHGHVLLHRDTAKSGRPVLGPAEELVPASSAGTKETEAAAPGRRTKVAVCDWDGDGLLDLLVGDFLLRMGEPPVLSEEDKAARGEAEQTIRHTPERISSIVQRLRTGAPEEGAEADPEVLAERMRERLEADEEYQALQREMTAAWQVLERTNPPRFLHGWVWLYRRKPPAPPEPAVPGSQDVSATPSR